MTRTVHEAEVALREAREAMHEAEARFREAWDAARQARREAEAAATQEGTPSH